MAAAAALHPGFIEITRVLLNSGKIDDAKPMVGEFLDAIQKDRKQLDNVSFRAIAKDMAQKIPDGLRTSLTPEKQKLIAYLESIPIPSTNPKYKKLGQGSYGYVVDPAVPNRVDGAEVHYPDNVTKVFTTEESYEQALEAARKYKELMGPNVNAGQRVNAYEHQYKIRNLYPELPKNILKQYNRGIYTEKRTYNDPMYMMRLPHLGTDIQHIVKDATLTKQLRSVPVIDILGQVKKLVTQTLRLVQGGYVHTDIRDTNIMIDPKFGVMTIIDFDWLLPKSDLYDQYPFTFYNNPPEVLSVCSELLDASCNPPPALTEDEKKRLQALRTQKKRTSSEATEMRVLNRKEMRFDDYQLFYDGYDSHFGTVMELQGISDKDAFTDALKPAVCDSVEYLMHSETMDRNVWFTDHIAPTFDNYGLGLSLLELFLYVYPACVTKEMIASANIMTGIDAFQTTLRSRITNRGTPYSEEELRSAAIAIRELANLFYSMGSFYLLERPTVDAVVTKVNTIIATYTGANQVGGGKRKTQRRRQKKRAKTSRRRR